MADRGGGIVRRLLRTRELHRLVADGGLIVDWTTGLSLVVTAGLVVYLAVALLYPEKFS